MCSIYSLRPHVRKKKHQSREDDKCATRRIKYSLKYINEEYTKSLKTLKIEKCLEDDKLGSKKECNQHYHIENVCSGYFTRSNVRQKHHLRIDDCKSVERTRNSLKKSTKEENPKSLKTVKEKIYSKNIGQGSRKESNILNYKDNSFHESRIFGPLELHSFRSNNSKSENIFSGYSLRSLVNNPCIGCDKSGQKKSLKHMNKKEYTYFLRPRKKKISIKLNTKNIESNSKNISDKLKCRKFKPNIQARKGCDNVGKMKEFDQFQEKSRIVQRSQRHSTKETNSSVSSSHSLKSERKLGNDKNVNNGIKNEKALTTYEKSAQFESIKKKNGGKNYKEAYHRSNSFKRYGVLCPSYENVLNNITKIRKEADALDAYEEEYGNLDNSLPLSLKNNNLETLVETNLLDCMNLCEEELKEYFHKNLEYIRNILNGTLPSQRHDRYKNYDPNTYLTMNDLTYSPSIVVFTSNQRERLFELLENQFDPKCEKTEYLFKVLLPELCLKIFMDVHEMPVGDALNYLDRRPLN